MRVSSKGTHLRIIYIITASDQSFPVVHSYPQVTPSHLPEVITLKYMAPHAELDMSIPIRLSTGSGLPSPLLTPPHTVETLSLIHI